MRVLRRTLTGTDDKFFIPFFILANMSIEIQLLHVKSPAFHISKKMTLIEMEFERSQIHFIFAVMFEQRLRDVCL